MASPPPVAAEPAPEEAVPVKGDASGVLARLVALNENDVISKAGAGGQVRALLHHLLELEQAMGRSSKAAVREVQTSAEQKLFRVLALESTRPVAPLRHAIARCLHILLELGEARRSFDVLAQLQRLLETRAVGDANRVAVVYILGTLSEAHGARSLSLFAETAQQLCRLLRKETEVQIRYETAVALTRAVNGQGRGASEATTRDVVKWARAGLSDKALTVRAACADLLRAVYEHAPTAPSTATVAEVEAQVSALFKLVDGAVAASEVGRHAFGQLAAAIVAKSLSGGSPNGSESPGASPGGAARGAGDAGDAGADDGDARGGADAAAGAGADSTKAGPPSEPSVNVRTGGLGGTPLPVLDVLGTHLTKASYSRMTRLVVVDAYASLFRMLGSAWVEPQYATVTRHLLECLASSKLNGSRSDALFARHIGMFLLRHVLGPLLTEAGQLSALKELGEMWVQRLSRPAAGTQGVGKTALVCALYEVGALAIELGAGANAAADPVVAALFQVLGAHTSVSVTAAAAYCLRCVAFALPLRLPRLLKQLLEETQEAANALAASASSPQEPLTTRGRQLLSRSAALAGLLTAVMENGAVYVSFDLLARVFVFASGLVQGTASSSDLLLRASGASAGTIPAAPAAQTALATVYVMTVQAQAGWLLSGALAAQSSEFVRTHLSVLLLQWSGLFPKPAGGQGSTSPMLRAEALTAAEWQFVLVSREAALGAMAQFLTNNGAALVTVELAKRLVLVLNNALAFLFTVPLLRGGSAGDSAGDPLGAALAQALPVHEDKLRQRLLQCFQLIEPASTFDATRSALLNVCREVFAPDADRVVACGPGPGPASGVAGSGDADGAFVTSLVHRGTLLIAGGETERSVARALAQDDPLGDLVAEARPGALQFAAEHDVQALGATLVRAAFRSSLSSGHLALRRTGGFGLLRDAGTSGTLATNETTGRLRSVSVGASSTTGSSFRDSPAGGGAASAPGGRTGLNAKSDTTARTHEETSVMPIPEAPPAATACVDAAIALFARLLPLESAGLQEQRLEQLLKVVRGLNGLPSSKCGAARRNAIKTNILASVLGCLWRMGAPGSAATNVAELAKTLATDSLGSGSDEVRALAAEVLGRLARVVGDHGGFTAATVNGLVDVIVAQREPDVRAGAALAFGAVATHVGGLAVGGNLLRTMVGILQSLAGDAHPKVHLWALHALSLTAEASGLAFGAHVSATLDVALATLSDAAHESSVALCHASLSDAGAGLLDPLRSSSRVLVGRVLYAVLNVLGPELAVPSATRALCFDVYEELRHESGNVFVVVEAIRCVQHFITFAAGAAAGELVPFLQTQLQRDERLPVLRKAAVTCLYQLAQRDAGRVLASARGLEAQLLGLLDEESDVTTRSEIRDTLLRLLAHMAPLQPGEWVRLATALLLRGGLAGTDNTGTKLAHVSPLFATSVALGAAPPASALAAPRWRTRVFVVQCLEQILECVAAVAPPTSAHFRLDVAKSSAARGSSDYLVLWLGDLVRLAFTAATASADALRLEGLLLLKALLAAFGGAPDPDFEGHALLEQYQAQFGSALSPAFSADAAPEVTCAACQVCAAYVSSGVNQELSALSRVMRLLTASLERLRDEPAARAAALSPHTFVMTQLAVTTAWAELHLASLRQAFLAEAVVPVIADVAPMWAAQLRDYARLKVGSRALSAAAGSELYVAATKQVLYPFYQRSWLTLLCSVSALQASDRALGQRVFASVDGDLCAVLRALAAEALVLLLGGSGEADGGAAAALSFSGVGGFDALPTILDALRTLVSGSVEMAPDEFGELLTLLDRTAQVGPPTARAALGRLLQALAAAPRFKAEPETLGGLFGVAADAVLYQLGTLSPAALLSSPLLKVASPETIRGISLALDAAAAVCVYAAADSTKDLSKESATLVFICFALLQSPSGGIAAAATLKAIAALPQRHGEAATVWRRGLQQLAERAGDGDPAMLQALGAVTAAAPEFALDHELYRAPVDAWKHAIATGDAAAARAAFQAVRAAMAELRLASTDAAAALGAILARALLPDAARFLTGNLGLPGSRGDPGAVEEAAKAVVAAYACSPSSAQPATLRAVVRVLLEASVWTDGADPQARRATCLRLVLSLATQNAGLFREMLLGFPPIERQELQEGLTWVVSLG